jgi:hydrogenase/urease accessory protein HupE
LARSSSRLARSVAVLGLVAVLRSRLPVVTACAVAARSAVMACAA